MKKFVKKYSPAIIAFAFLGFFTIAILSYNNFNKDNKKKDLRIQLLDNLIAKKSQLEKSLYSRLYYTKGVAAYVTLNPNILDVDFQNLAKELIKNDSVISTMSLARDCIISSIYPYKGHEAAVGLDLLAHPKRKMIVDRTIKTRNTFVAGPVELIEGGIAFISYTPIFNGSNIQNDFWGVTDIVIKRDELLREVNLIDNDNTYLYAIRGVDGQGSKGDIFWGNKEVFTNDYVSVNILLPTGNWVLAAYPKSGWINHNNKSTILIYLLFIAAFVISFLIWLQVRSYLKLKANECQLRALFGSMQDIVIEFNKEGRYLKIAPTNESLLIKPANELIGRTVHEFFPKEIAEQFHNAIKECLETKSLIILEYPLTIGEKDLWFQARLSYISEDRMIFVAHDNTEEKLSKEALVLSERNLKELNATKDKFFSILAHDLKGPLGSFVHITNMLHSNFEDFSKEDNKELLEIMYNTSLRVYELLENLLLWSRAQRGNIEFLPVQGDLWYIAESVKSFLEATAKQKKISIENKIPQDTFVNFDVNMISTVIRNLTSNSIKYTKESGMITISINNEDSNSEYIIIEVKDNGIGIEETRINKLFQIDQNISTPGTNDERGSGLGLILCKEFVEMHNGKIWVKSELGKGSTFSFSLALNMN